MVLGMLVCMVHNELSDGVRYLVCMVHNELSDGVRYVGVYEFVNELINNNNVK